MSERILVKFLCSASEELHKKLIVQDLLDINLSYIKMEKTK